MNLRISDLCGRVALLSSRTSIRNRAETPHVAISFARRGEESGRRSLVALSAPSVMFVCAAVLLFAVSAAGRPGDRCRKLSFKSMAQAAPLGSGPASTSLFLATSAQEAEPFLPWLKAQDQTVVRGNDWTTRAVVAVFRGAMGTSGFGITVQQLCVKHGRLRATVALQDPLPEGMARPAFTTPYHILAVRKSAFVKSAPSAWIVETNQGSILAQRPEKKP